MIISTVKNLDGAATLVDDAPGVSRGSSPTRRRELLMKAIAQILNQEEITWRWQRALTSLALVDKEVDVRADGSH